MPVTYDDEKRDFHYPFQNKKIKRIAMRVTDRLTDMKEARNNAGDQEWDVWTKLYRSEPTDSPPEAWQANVVVPFIMSVILAIQAEITARRARWKVLPQSPEDIEKAETIQAITDFTLEKGRYDDESFKRDLDKLIYGTSIWKEIYREDRRVLRVKKDDEEIEEKDIREFQDVYGKHIPIWNFYLDDKATDIREARDCIERQIMDIDDFKTRYSKYKNAKKVPKWGFIKPSVSESTINALPPGGDVTQEDSYSPISSIKDNEVEILEYWNKPRDEHVIVANGVVVVNEPIPYDHKQLPYAMDVCVPLPNSAYGMGVPKVLQAPAEELNTLHNMMIDETKLSIHAPILMGGTTLLDEGEYQLRPKGIIPVDDVDQARELRSSGIMAAHFQMFEEVKQTIRTGAGMDVRFAEAASPTGGSDTATEVLRLQEASLRRIGLYVKLLEIRCLPRIATLRTANIQQFYQDPLRVKQIVSDENQVKVDEGTGKPLLKKEFRTIRIQDEGKDTYSFKEIKPEDVRANVDVYVVPQSTQPLSQAVMSKRINTALQTILAFPPALEVVDITALFRHYFKSIDIPTAIVRDTLIGEENDDYDSANEENEQMAGGKKVPPTKNPGIKHTAVHGAFIYVLDQDGMPTGQLTERFQGLSREIKQNIMNHYQGELSQHAAKGTISAEAVGRTPSREQGIGQQSVLSGEQEVAAPSGGP